MATYFPKLTLTNEFCFSVFQIHPNEVSIFPIYLHEDIFVRGQFYKFQEF